MESECRNQLLKRCSLNKSTIIEEIPRFIDKTEDNVRVYKITGKGKVTAWGEVPEFDEEIILI